MLSCDSEIPGTHRTNFGISFAEVVTVSPVSLLAAEKVAPYFRLIRYYDQNGFILDASNDFASVLSRTADSKEDPAPTRTEAERLTCSPHRHGTHVTHTGWSSQS